jgi:uncharacterized membrane protein YdjX (TVP38/TMEM64 family)
VSARQWSAGGIVLSFLIGMGVLALSYAFGSRMLGMQGQGSVETLLAHAAEGPFAPLWVMLVFSGLAIAGVPQFMLIAATVVVFGPWLGGLYSWLATMASSALGFALGRLFAQRMLARYGGERLNQLSTLIARHGIASMALIRVVPGAPFIVINVAAGATAISAAKFALGTGLGIIPKIAFIMLLGAGVMDALTHWRPVDILWIGAAIGLWLLIGYAAKRYWDRLHRN